MKVQGLDLVRVDVANIWACPAYLRLSIRQIPWKLVISHPLDRGVYRCYPSNTAMNEEEQGPHSVTTWLRG